MMHHSFSVYDKAATAFLPLFFVRSKGEAVRTFLDAVNDEKHQFHSHADDYVLFFMGTFDDNTGEFEQPVDGPTQIMLALDALRGKAVL